VEFVLFQGFLGHHLSFVVLLTCVNIIGVFYLLVSLISILCIVKMYVGIVPVTQLRREKRAFHI
jgi:hypothetical protein